jgi:hypothetical protein
MQVSAPVSFPAVAAALLVASSLLAPARANAESEYGFGVVPGVQFGPNFGSVPSPGAVPTGATPAEPQSARGWLLEPHVDAIFAGSTFGVGASLGYVLQGVANPYDASSIGMGYDGVTLTPMVMFALHPRVFLVGKGGLVFGAIANGLADDLDTTGWRAGGQIMFVAYRNAGADLTLGLGFIHTEAKGDYPGNGGSIAYSANAIAIDSTFSFFSEMLDL